MHVCIEQPGEKNKKNIFDKNSGLIKTVSFHLTYPYPYGYIVDTLAPDGDELDCYVITDKKLQAGSIILSVELWGWLNGLKTVKKTIKY